MAAGNAQVGTLSETDKVAHGVLVPAWAKFADLTIEQKFEQARLMTFEELEAYLHERCCAAKMEVASAASALDRATAIIEANLPFFVIHFAAMDKRGERSDLKGKVVGRTEWLARNMPNISRGTFYAAYNTVKNRFAEHINMLTEGPQPEQQDEASPAGEANPPQPRPQPKPKLKLTQRDINRLIKVGREAAQVAQIGLKPHKSAEDYLALRTGCANIANWVTSQKLDSLMAESAKEAEADIQRGKAANAAKRLAELALSWCKQNTNQVRGDSKLLKIAQSAQEFMNLVDGTHDEFVLAEISKLAQPEGKPTNVIPPRQPAAVDAEPERVTAQRRNPPCRSSLATTTAGCATAATAKTSSSSPAATDPW